MRYAIVETATGRVDNVILWDGESLFIVPDSFELIALGDTVCGPEWIYADGIFTPPTE